MNHKKLTEIFPAYYPKPLSPEQIERKCKIRIQKAGHPDDILAWIEREPCPLMREALAEGVRYCLQNPDETTCCNSVVREEMELQLCRLIRRAQGDQVANELMAADPMLCVHTDSQQHETHLTELENRVAWLTGEVQQLKQAQHQEPSLLWPFYTDKATEEQKRDFEHYLRMLATSSKRSATADVKLFLDRHEKEGIISRPAQLNAEYELICRFGYTRRPKTYYNA